MSRVDTGVPAMKKRLDSARAGGAYFLQVDATDYPFPLSDLAECLIIAGAIKAEPAPLFHAVIAQLRKEPDPKPRRVKRGKELGERA